VIRSFLSDISLSDTLKLLILIAIATAALRWADMAQAGGFGV
jgi:hypothetical protein